MSFFEASMTQLLMFDDKFRARQKGAGYIGYFFHGIKIEIFPLKLEEVSIKKWSRRGGGV